MLKIRLARIGRKNDPTFRVVVTEHTRGPKSGKHLEILGNYNPKMDEIKLNGERILHFISHGAQVSDTVHNLLIKEGVIKGKKINVLPKKSPIVKEDEESKEEATKEAPTEESKEEAPIVEETTEEPKVEEPKKEGEKKEEK